jgi:hypothetical protein
MWYLIVSEQISGAKNNINKTRTMEQILEAEQRAAEWMRKTRKIPPGSIEDGPGLSAPRKRDTSSA